MSVTAGVLVHVCGCCFVLYNKLLGVCEAAGSREPSLSRAGGERWRLGEVRTSESRGTPPRFYLAVSSMDTWCF